MQECEERSGILGDYPRECLDVLEDVPISARRQQLMWMRDRGNDASISHRYLTDSLSKNQRARVVCIYSYFHKPPYSPQESDGSRAADQVRADSGIADSLNHVVDTADRHTVGFTEELNSIVTVDDSRRRAPVDRSSNSEVCNSRYGFDQRYLSTPHYELPTDQWWAGSKPA